MKYTPSDIAACTLNHFVRILSLRGKSYLLEIGIHASNNQELLSLNFWTHVGLLSFYRHARLVRNVFPTGLAEFAHLSHCGKMAPKVLVLGGVGFIGRTLVSYLIENNLCSLCRVVDKVLPATAYLSETHKAHFADPKVEFKQANLCNAASCEKAFTIEGGGEFDIVFDLASETKYGQAEAVYEEKVFKIAVVIGTEAAKRRIPVFVEVSTAQLYDGGKKAATEDSKIKPWTLVAKAKAKAEDALREISGLNLILIRPSVVYGPNDVLGISTIPF